jgi:hypothetical protein
MYQRTGARRSIGLSRTRLAEPELVPAMRGWDFGTGLRPSQAGGWNVTRIFCSVERSSPIRNTSVFSP